MKIRVIKDHDHRVRPAVTMAFKARDEPIDVPKAIGEALIAAGAAKRLTKPKPSKQED